jgi:hypothetical protein
MVVAFDFDIRSFFGVGGLWSFSLETLLFLGLAERHTPLDKQTKQHANKSYYNHKTN